MMPVKEFDSIDSAEMAFKEPYCIVGVFSLILHCSYICLDKRQKTRSYTNILKWIGN